MVLSWYQFYVARYCKKSFGGFELVVHFSVPVADRALLLVSAVGGDVTVSCN